MLNFAMWLNLMQLFCCSTTHIKTFEKQVTCILPSTLPPLPIYKFLTVNGQNMCPFYCAVPTPEDVHTHPAFPQSTSRCFCSPCTSTATQNTAPPLYLIEAADCVSMFALHYYSHTGCVIGSCFLSAFYTTVYHSADQYGIVTPGGLPGLIMCFLSGNAVS
jgi:hypothetical protein